MENASKDIRTGSAPNFCPPLEEGITISLEDDKGDQLELEFLGLLLLDGARYGFFFPLDGENQPLESGEIVVLRAIEFDEDDQPVEFELVEDEDVAMRAYHAFREATKDLYIFE